MCGSKKPSAKWGAYKNDIIYTLQQLFKSRSTIRNKVYAIYIQNITRAAHAPHMSR